MKSLRMGCLTMLFFAILLIVGAVNGIVSLVWIGIFGAGISALLALIFDNKETLNLKEKLDKEMNQKLHEVVDFNATQKFTSEDRETLIAIDETNKKVCILENQFNNDGKELIEGMSNYLYKVHVFNFSDIIQSEIITDGVTVTKSSRKEQLGGAIIGGSIAGGVGAIIGSSGASQKSEQEVSKIQLQVVVNNTIKSFFRITFGYFPEKTSSSSSEYVTSEKKATHWHNLMTHILKSDNDSSSDKKLTKNESYSVADELMKLSQLLKEGLITQEEFDKQKQKLI